MIVKSEEEEEPQYNSVSVVRVRCFHRERNATRFFSPCFCEVMACCPIQIKKDYFEVMHHETKFKNRPEVNPAAQNAIPCPRLYGISSSCRRGGRGKRVRRADPRRPNVRRDPAPGGSAGRRPC
ncbi:hypothetical protein FOCC_FOCC001571 [Frankliniella occidentalis]|nr:hypothetical protein FOCC_FOCC001571 [Frankliniella occidentalis]